MKDFRLGGSTTCRRESLELPAAFLFYSVAMLLYSSSVKGNTGEELSSLIGDNLRHLGFVVISPGPLTSSWCATWLAVTRQGGFGAVVSLKIFLMICHAFRLLRVRSVDVIISSCSPLPVSRGMLSKGCSCTASCIPHIGSSILQINQECSGFYTPLVYVSSMSHIWLRQTSRILWNMVNLLNKDINAGDRV